MAESQDSIDFFAKYKNWVVSRSINCTSSTIPVEVSAYLSTVREDVSKGAFEVLGIDMKSLESYSDKFSKQFPKGDYSALVKVYKTLGSTEADAEIIKAAQGREELKPFAKAYLFRTALERLGLLWYVPKNSKVFQGKAVQRPSGTVPFSTDGISFMAKYKEWISIKKLSIDSKTKPEEVSAHLSSIRIATDRKIPQILGVNTDSLDVYASEVTGNMRKSAANLEKITQALCSPEAKKQIDATSTPQIRDAAVIYLFNRMVQNLKIDLEVSPDTLMDMFPGLKIPKPKGRMPGQKKKA